MFDEFLDELRRRQAEAEGRVPPRPEPADDDDGPSRGDDDRATRDPQHDAPDDDAEPVPIEQRRRGESGRPPGRPPRRPGRRPVGGPNDGASGARRQIFVGVAIVAVSVLSYFMISDRVAETAPEGAPDEFEIAPVVPPVSSAPGE